MTDTTILKTVYFDAAPETVWSFLTDKDKLGTWYHPAEADLAMGEEYALYRIADDGAQVRQVWGRVIEMTPPERLVTTFCVAPFEGRETTVTWELDAVAGDTRLCLRHEGILDEAGEAALPLLMALDRGWDEHLGRFRAAPETP